MSKLAVITVGAAAYVFGTKAGRKRYDEIRAQATRLWHDPRVQKKRAEAADLAKDKAPEFKDKVGNAAKHAAGKVKTGTRHGADL